MGLLGDQRKIDVNKDGEITAKDFEMLREQRQSGGLLDDDMMRVGYANGTPDDGGERVMLMQQKAMQMMQKSPLDVAYDQMIMDIEDNPDLSGFRKSQSNFDMFIQDQESKDMFLNLLKNRDEILERKEKAEGGLFDKVVETASEFTGAGPVEGPGTGTSDDIPARLSDGEFVFTAKAVEQLGADNLMKMMKDAEAAYDAGGEREAMQEGGLTSVEEEQENPMRGSYFC
jgi:hypothetical protein